MGLLPKAQLLKRGANDPKVIRVHEPRRTKAGKPSKKLYLKRNRAGAPLTLSLLACAASLDKDPATRLEAEIKSNLEALIAIRDNAAHYINASAILAKQVLEIASASVKNFIIASKAWFNRDFSDSLSLVLPLSFVSGGREVDSVVVTAGEFRELVGDVVQVRNGALWLRWPHRPRVADLQAERDVQLNAFGVSG